MAVKEIFKYSADISIYHLIYRARLMTTRLPANMFFDLKQGVLYITFIYLFIIVQIGINRSVSISIFCEDVDPQYLHTNNCPEWDPLSWLALENFCNPNWQKHKRLQFVIRICFGIMDWQLKSLTVQHSHIMLDYPQLSFLSQTIKPCTYICVFRVSQTLGDGTEWGESCGWEPRSVWRVNATCSTLIAALFLWRM